MDTLTIGFILAGLVVGGGAFALISSMTGVGTSWLKTLGLSSGAGIFGGIASIFTDTYAYLSASAFGQLGIYGYLYLFGIGALLLVWAFNGWSDFSKDKPINMIH